MVTYELFAQTPEQTVIMWTFVFCISVFASISNFLTALQCLASEEVRRLVYFTCLAPCRLRRKKKHLTY